MKRFRKYLSPCSLTAIIASIAVIYSGLIFADQLALPTGDLIAPMVEHDPDKNPITQGNKHTVIVKVTDNVGVKTVLLFYRTIGMSKLQAHIDEQRG